MNFDKNGLLINEKLNININNNNLTELIKYDIKEKLFDISFFLLIFKKLFNNMKKNEKENKEYEKIELILKNINYLQQKLEKIIESIGSTIQLYIN